MHKTQTHRRTQAGGSPSSKAIDGRPTPKYKVQELPAPALLIFHGPGLPSQPSVLQQRWQGRTPQAKTLMYPMGSVMSVGFCPAAPNPTLPPSSLEPVSQTANPKMWMVLYSIVNKSPSSLPWCSLYCYKINSSFRGITRLFVHCQGCHRCYRCKLEVKRPATAT